MFATLVSLLMAIYLILGPYVTGENLKIPVIESAMLAIAVPLLFFLPLAFFFCWLPLQRAENDSTPRIIDTFKKDKHLHLMAAWSMVFALFTLFCSIGSFHPIPQQWLFAFWIVGLGLTLDANRHFVMRVLSYLNPFDSIELFAKEAKGSIQKENEQNLCLWIDALSEMALKGIHKQSASVSNAALDALAKTTTLFLEASKSIGHQTEDKQMLKMGIKDKVSFTLFFLYQRFDLIFDAAVKNSLEPTCTKMITLMGKIAVATGVYDMSLASTPLRFLGKFAKKAQEHRFEEAVLTASCTFTEVAKALLTDVDITYYEIRDPFLSIINGMEVITKKEFQRDKNTSIPLLMQPFQELKALFETGKAKEHQDTPVILLNINRVLGEFEALQLVMATVPKVEVKE